MGKATEYTRVAVDKLIPYVNNAKQHSDSQVTKIASSIREFGFLNPVLIDADYNVIAGHGRILAAKKLGLSEVPCLFVEGLTEAQRKAYILADNRLSELGEWDMELVMGELAELDELGFDTELTGFEFEIEPEIIDDEDDIPEPPEEPRAKLGDLYKLGRHRLICGDSTDVNVVERLMGGAEGRHRDNVTSVWSRQFIEDPQPLCKRRRYARLVLQRTRRQYIRMGRLNSRLVQYDGIGQRRAIRQHSDACGQQATTDAICC